MIKEILNTTQERMGKVEKVLINDFVSLRTGRATPALLERIKVDFYGTPTPINQTANIACPEPRLIVVQPWDKNNISAIEKAILKSDLGITPANDGVVIRLALPQLTEERRKEIAKQCHKKAEDAKVAIRNIRRDVNDAIKAAEKAKECSQDEAENGHDDAQKMTDKAIKRVDEILSVKEKEIMEV